MWAGRRERPDATQQLFVRVDDDVFGFVIAIGAAGTASRDDVGDEEMGEAVANTQECGDLQDERGGIDRAFVDEKR